MRSLGALPLDRSQAASAVSYAVDMFEARDSFYFALAPEGTRSLKNGWKSGFYRIAREAGVPVFLGALDFGSRKIGLAKRIDLTGDVAADMKRFAEFYSTVQGRCPENTSPVQLQ